MSKVPVKTFKSRAYSNTLAPFTEKMIGVEFEKACLPIAYDILKNYEAFETVEDGPSLRGRPFDLFGYRREMPYIIEVKSSLKRFHAPGEVQKDRLQAILRSIPNLHIALLQIKIRAFEYRILYDEQLRTLFDTKHVSLSPIVAWLNARMPQGASETK